jgi:hypothetical protein
LGVLLLRVSYTTQTLLLYLKLQMQREVQLLHAA